MKNTNKATNTGLLAILSCSSRSSLLLRAPLSAAFWQGAPMVCGGAILCWLATRAVTD
ncbi:hypothetical protein [Janthinobacterium sp. PC23-8]|uniref:hypothetical protein n=1 Tax=Janthinobacterium sp. PC23-8 TaxID=2012679 RepID=UPI0015956406|nr:hypothetical protein [Janthinobacterium sp. PC23-8]